MLVTLPIVSLLLDIWPPARVRLWPGQGQVWRGLILQQVPMLILAAASSIVTILVQSRASAVETLGQISLTYRLTNVIDSYVQYIRQTVWPSGMEAFYP